MSDRDRSALTAREGRPEHPGSLELRHYARGTLERGHASAVLAHCVLCADCGDDLARLLTRPARRLADPRAG